jgi:hypothetical protein
MLYQENQYDATIVLDATQTKQRGDGDLVDYTRRFKAAKDIMESHFGSKLKIKKMAKADPAWKDKDEPVMEECHERTFAWCCCTWRTQIRPSMDDQFSLNQDQNLQTILHATNVLSNHKFDP